MFLQNLGLDCLFCALGSNKGADKLLPSPKTDGFQCHNHNWCDYFCSAIGMDYFQMVFSYKIIVNDVFRWLSIIGPAMRLYRCIAEV